MEAGAETGGAVEAGVAVAVEVEVHTGARERMIWMIGTTTGAPPCAKRSKDLGVSFVHVKGSTPPQPSSGIGDLGAACADARAGGVCACVPGAGREEPAFGRGGEGSQCGVR